MAIPHHRTRRGPGGVMIVLVLILLIAAAGAGLWYSGALKPTGAAPAAAPKVAAGPQKFSTKCKFTDGDRAGQTVDFAPHAPLPVGSDCNDGTDSSGVVVE